MKYIINQRGFAPLIAILIILGVILVGGGAYYVEKQSGPVAPVVLPSDKEATTAIVPTDESSVVKSFSVSGKNFVIKGENLSKVEVWAIPSGTGMTVADYRKVLSAISYTGSVSAQIFTVAIPCSVDVGVGIDGATNLFVRGYNQKGTVLSGEVTLAYIGVTEIYENVGKNACPVNANSDTTYKDTNAGFQISYPSDYGLHQEGSEIILIPTDKTKATVHVYTEEQYEALSVLLPGTYGGRYTYPSDGMSVQNKDVVYSESTTINGIQFGKDYWVKYGGMGSWDQVINAHTRKGARYYTISLDHQFVGGVPGENGATQESIAAKALVQMRDSNNSYVKSYNAILATFKLI